MEEQKLESLEVMAQKSINSSNLSIEALAEYFKNYHEFITQNNEIFSSLSLEDSLNVLKKFQADGLQLDEGLGIDVDEAILHFEDLKLNEKYAVLGSALEKRIEQILETDDLDEKSDLLKNLFIKLHEKPAKFLRKLFNKKYLEQNKYAITYTSLMVFISAIKASTPDSDDTINFPKYIREFLAYSQTDDKEIFEMKTFYLNNVSAENIKLGVNEGESEENLSKDTIALRKRYDDLINSFKNKYEDSKLYLKVS